MYGHMPMKPTNTVPMSKHLLPLAFLVLSVTAEAQTAGIRIGTHPGDSTRVDNVSLGLLSDADTVRGIQVNALLNASRQAEGVQASVVTNFARQLRGVQLSGFSNMATDPFKGVQLSGITNIATGVDHGLQLTGILNVSAGYMRGAQMAAYNYADSLNGTQIGLVNVARTHPRGWQVGVINYSRDTIAHKLGLVNVNPQTAIDYMLYGGTATKGNAAIRFRNRSTYSIMGAGTHYMGLDEKFSGALFYRIGQYHQLSPRLSVSGDLGFSHIETFQQHSATKPERLYSLQARLNGDYRLSRTLALFVTVGYGDTRYYRHSTRYKHGMLFEAGLTVRQPRTGSKNTDTAEDEDGRQESDAGLDGAGGWSPFLTAGLEVTGINAFVHLFDRFVLDADYAQTTMHTWRRNFSHGFVWDNDQFSTNLFAHPYHGNLYFNAARSSGLNFWQSAPFAMGGSLMWEFLGEREPPAINDLLATTMGGISIGEVMHRVSSVILNDRTRGFNRFLREAGATLVNPMRGLNRIVSGDAWRVRSDHYLYHDHDAFPLDLAITAGSRYLADDGALFRGEHNPFVNFFLEYGDPLNEDGHHRPYDFFDAEVTFGLSSNQPLINGMHLVGRLWSTPVIEGHRLLSEFGFYQHFNYYDSKPVKDGSSLTPYRISEAASLGPGLIIQMLEVGALSRLEQRLFLSGILLGGTKSDYYNVIDRDYNMGSGLSMKSKTHMEMRHFGRFIMHVQYYSIFTWKGYEQKDLTTVDPLYLNAQGDKGNARLVVINPIVELDFSRQLSLSFSGSYFMRRTHYKYYNDVEARTFEARLGLVWHP